MNGTFFFGAELWESGNRSWRVARVVSNNAITVLFLVIYSCFSFFFYLSFGNKKNNKKQKPLDVTNHSVAREVVTFFTLPPGDYVVVPQTGVAHCEGKFLLRIFTDEHSNIWLDFSFSITPKSRGEKTRKIALTGLIYCMFPICREVNEDNMIFRNVAAEGFEDGFKHVRTT